jgi:hypothetical protein
MDQEPHKRVLVMKDFLGLVSDIDHSDCPPGGMVEEVNIFSKQVGSLTTRGGLLEVETEFLE